MTKLRLAEDLEEPRYGTVRRWKGKRLLTKAEKLERQRILTRKWRDKNRAKMREYFRDYARKHPELKSYMKNYYKANSDKWKGRKEDPGKRRVRYARSRDEQLPIRRALRLKNGDRIRENERRNRAKHREKKRERDRVYRISNPETYKESIARAKAKNPELYRQIQVQTSLKRRARKRSQTVEQVSTKRVYARDGNRCHLCCKLVELSERSLDHLIPIARGGAHAEWNLMVAHLICNKSRGVKRILLEETRAMALAYIDERIA